MVAQTNNSICLTLARKPSDRFARLRSIAQDPVLDYRTTLARIHRETINHLDSLGRHAGEGKNVLEVSFFCRWLVFSGVIDLLEKHALPEQDFTGLTAKVDALQAVCRPHLQGQSVKKVYSEPDITLISEKLDTLLAAVARPVVVTAVTTTSVNDDETRNQLR